MTNSPEANLELMRTTFERFNAGDIDACLDRLTPDFIINLAMLPQPMHGRETWKQGVDVMRAAFPDFHAEIEDMVAMDDRVAMRLTHRGTHRGEFQGIPATGRVVAYQSHEFYRIAGGLIAEEWICSDMATLYQQIS
ncbi:steroid delta-isomerase-like uncharacterized protein [Micromonospora pisi]|uniref:Steroid delta-isomerase-like uncharacterized protein n=1 Tax=Micromonospora pisi TaxID=589240 RepID=A0A495JBZ3_9ACTN|nr:ester cyclase [Micromonospora pisi]RKR86435.1 steroid delta-isomerase-like uncharacterized protein [Micromonospora pisi]